MPEVIGGLSAADIAAIRTASGTYVETALSRNSEAWMKVLADDAVFMPPNMEALDTPAKIRAWIDSFPRMSMFRLTSLEIDGRVDMAYVRGRYEYSVESASDRGKYLEIWRREADGAWRLFRDIWNSDLTA